MESGWIECSSNQPAFLQRIEPFKDNITTIVFVLMVLIALCYVATLIYRFCIVDNASTERDNEKSYATDIRIAEVRASANVRPEETE